MRKIFVSSLSTLTATALLALLLAPLALCGQTGSCPMRQARAGTGAEIDCVPGPAFDCCNGDESPRSRGSEQLSAKQIPAAFSVGTPALVALTVERRAERDRSLEPLGSAADTPLYTLLATLLI